MQSGDHYLLRIDLGDKCYCIPYYDAAHGATVKNVKMAFITTNASCNCIYPEYILLEDNFLLFS